MNVLLTDGGHKNTLAIIRHLALNGHRVSILHHKKSAPAYSRYCYRLYRCPTIYDSADYIACLLRLLKNESFDVLIPVGGMAYSILSAVQDEIRCLTRMEIADEEKIKLALDKTATYRFAEEKNIPHPKTIYPKTIDEISLLLDTLKFPLVLKSPSETFKAFLPQYFKNKEDLLQKLPETIQMLSGGLPVIQEMVKGDGYGFYAVYNRGEMVQYFMHQRIREYPPSGGVSSCAKSFCNEELKELGKAVLDELKWHGPAMVEFKREHETGRFKLIEINPKFWGSLDLSLVAGINFPEIICRLNDKQTSHAYNEKIYFQWLFSSGGEFYRLLHKPSDFFKVIARLFASNTKNDVWLRDPLPNIKQFTDFVIHLFR